MLFKAQRRSVHFTVKVEVTRTFSLDRCKPLWVDRYKHPVNPQYSLLRLVRIRLQGRRCRPTQSAILQIHGPQTGSNGIRKREENASNRHQLQQIGDNAKAGVWTPILLHKLVAFARAPPLELEVTCMCSRASRTALQEDVHGGTHSWNSIETAVHQ